MASIRLVASLALVTACYRQDPDVYQTLPEPTEVQGPPGGAMDPVWQQGYVDDNSAGAIAAPVEAAADPNAPGYAMGQTTDAEIDATLEGYGEWIYVDGYGEVWRPYTTSVGVNFTPYETCGSWVWTDWGWTFACEWDWGWLPFHYGQWGWFDDYWAWVPGYDWSPAWVDWRGGGGYVGWRPQAPIVHDHRGQHHGLVVHDHRTGGPIVRDHRSGTLYKAQSKDWQWRFAAIGDFGKPRIRSHLFKSPAEGLRVTSLVAHPPVRATVQPVKAESIMRARLAAASRLGSLGYSGVRGQLSRVSGSRAEPARGVQPGRVTGWERPRATPAASDDAIVAPSGYRPPMREPARAPVDDGARPRGPEQEFGGLPTTPTTPTPEPIDPPRGPIVSAPTQPTPPAIAPPTSRPPRAPIATTTPPTDTAPPRPSYEPPAHPPRVPTYTAPTPPTRAPERPSYTPPVYAPPTRPSAPPTYSAPTRSSPPPTYSPPTYSPPTHSTPTYSPTRSSTPSYSPPAPTYSPPAVPSGGFSGGARGHRR